MCVCVWGGAALLPDASGRFRITHDRWTVPSTWAGVSIQLQLFHPSSPSNPIHFQSSLPSLLSFSAFQSHPDSHGVLTGRLRRLQRLWRLRRRGLGWPRGSFEVWMTAGATRAGFWSNSWPQLLRSHLHFVSISLDESPSLIGCQFDGSQSVRGPVNGRRNGAVCMPAPSVGGGAFNWP